MAAQTTVSIRQTAAEQTDHVLLRRTLIANTLFSGTAGVAMALFSNPIASLMGVAAPEFVLFVGIGLIMFAAFVGMSAREVPLNRTKGWAIFWMDVLWVDASILLLLTNALNLSTAGNILVLVAAFGVADFAFFEWLGLRRGKNNR